MPPPTTIHHHPQPHTTTRYLSPTAKIYPPTPTTTQKMDHYPAKVKIFLTLFQQFLFLRNTILLYVAEISWDKVLISKFFKFKISTKFYDI